MKIGITKGHIINLYGRTQFTIYKESFVKLDDVSRIRVAIQNLLNLTNIYFYKNI